MTEETVEIPLSVAQDMADHHKQLAKVMYADNNTAPADHHHSWARTLHDEDEREWDEVGDD